VPRYGVRSQKGARLNREDIVALFTRRNDAWTRHDAEALTADFAENAVADSPIQGRLQGRERIRQAYDNWFVSFHDLTYTPGELLIDGDRAAQFFTIRGTQSAPFGGIPATGRRIVCTGVVLLTFGPDGRISYDRRLYDVTAVLVQLGVLKGKPVEV
jgi:steroid delta-isomerase-like uncharacterized protein